MLGYNGGLMGSSRSRTVGSTSIPGMWLPWENLEGRRNLTWAGSPLLLDLFLGSTAAYSLRNLRLAYATNPVVRVRRSTDSTEQDFTADQVVDATSTGMLAWVKETSATANGFVRTWYDQSGSNNHAEQTNTTIQPRIVTSGVLETDGVKPSILFGQASGVHLQPPSIGGLAANCAFFTATKHTNSTSDWSWFLGERVGGGTMIIGKRQSSSTLHVVGFGGGAGDVSAATITASSIGYWQQGSGISRYFINTSGGSLPGGSATADFRIGNRASNANEVWVGYISEIIYFPTSQITTNASISFTMNKYYNYYIGMSATGGNTTEDIIINNILYRVHTFTTVGTSSFIVNTTGSLEYLVIAGGGGGGSGWQGGGGGAGGLLTGSLGIASGSYNITVGDGGLTNTNGGNSVFSSITATGGGRGASEFSNYGGASSGGSGGGGGHPLTYTGGAGTSGQGFAGGNGTTTNFSSGGGGGASGTGETADGDEVGGAAGGLGLALNFNGTTTTYSTGGKGSRRGDNTTGVTGVSNTGNGGGGSSSTNGTGTGAKGGSGIVIIRYPI